VAVLPAVPPGLVSSEEDEQPSTSAIRLTQAKLMQESAPKERCRVDTKCFSIRCFGIGCFQI